MGMLAHAPVALVVMLTALVCPVHSFLESGPSDTFWLVEEDGGDLAACDTPSQNVDGIGVGLCGSSSEDRCAGGGNPEGSHRVQCTHFANFGLSSRSRRPKMGSGVGMLRVQFALWWAALRLTSAWKPRHCATRRRAGAAPQYLGGCFGL